MKERVYDAFLSHNSMDRSAVESIAEWLSKEAHIKVWIDSEDLSPGDSCQQGLESGILQSRTCVIFFGRHGMGNWQEVEFRLAFQTQVESKQLRIIPVSLPDGPKPNDPGIPPFISGLNWISFDEIGDEIQTLNRLAAGIQGQLSSGTERPSTVARSHPRKARGNRPNWKILISNTSRLTRLSLPLLALAGIMLIPISFVLIKNWPTDSPSDADLARAIHEINGSFVTGANHGYTTIPPGEPLPPSPFEVTKLDLSSDKLPSQEQLRDFPYPNKIEVFESRTIGNAQLAAISRFKNIWNLNLSGSKISDQSVASLAHFPNLRSLYITECHVGDSFIRELGKLEPLRENLIELHAQHIRASADGWEAALKDLTLRGLQIGPVELTSNVLTNLAKSYKLSNLVINSKEPWPDGWQELRSIQLSTLDSAGVAPPKEMLDWFVTGGTGEHLYLNHSSIDDSFLENWNRPGSIIRTLHFNNAEITADGLRHIKYLNLLEALSLANCAKIDDRAVPLLSEFSGLKTLKLAGTAISQSGRERLSKALPKCTID